ncbi:MAG TPA: LapA family protein [Rhodocyclaceae bacterium]|nr:LapA family protein [Rhodocyclaceae bacterium]
MKFLLWLLRIAVFIALFGLSIKNSGSVDLRFFFNQTFVAPLSLVLLLTFVLGVVVGVTALFSVFIGQRREIARLKQNQADSVSASNTTR